jgi:glycosyltransferase involved in cell wall biosynthesis
MRPLLREHNYDVMFFPAGNRRLPGRLSCPTVGTVHDWSSLHVVGKYDAARAYYIRRVLPRLVRQLTHVITVSESSKDDIVRYAGVDPARITVIPNGVNQSAFRPFDRCDARRKVARGTGLIGPYMLYLSRIEHPGKNHVRLIRAFERFKLETDLPHRLVLAGSDWTRADVVHQAAQQSPYRDSIVFTGFVDTELLPALYRAADLMVFPSLYEGFGIPVAEAMASGTPVVCADRSSLPEVGGDSVRYINPDDPTSIADGMIEVLTEPAVAAALRAKGVARSRRFTWDVAAQQTAAVLQDAAREGA